jgi:hypothetical protein
MRWFRAKQKFGGRLALFALAIQLILSFGHIHREDIYGPSYGAPAPAAANQTADKSQQLPSDRPAKHGDDYCAICATISLLSASFAAQPPQLPLPFVSRVIEHVDRVTVALVAPRCTPFQSRAPPAA